MSAVPSLPDEVLQNGTTNGDPNGQSIQHEPQRSPFSLSETPLENQRPIKVVVIGAGFCGIYAGIRIPERIRNCELVIYEKNEGVGGTWWQNRYPGCACDIPSHSYQYSFNPNPRWSALYAPAREIQAYIESTMKKYSVDRFIKLMHRIEECRFDEPSGKWHLKVTNLETKETFSDSCDVVINARGGLNDMKWPNIDGLNSFKGEVMHSAKWNEEYDFKNRKVGVIGSGSSAIQIVPNLQKLPGITISTFVRNRTWISPPFSQALWDQMGMNGLEFTQEQKDEFANNPDALRKFRIDVEADGNAIHEFTIRDTPTQNGARQHFEATMKQRLAKKPEIYDKLLPNFSPGCRRLTPGPGYLEALCEDNVDFVTAGIEAIEADGVRTEDGKLHELDALVCATGFNTSSAPPFPIYGQRGRTLSAQWGNRPQTYMSLATDSFPNMYFMLGPNGAIGSGSLTNMMEATGDYIVRCVRKMQKENIRSMAVKRERVLDFVEYADAYFKKTVFSEDCRSWYKNSSGSVTGLWPGSTLHCIEALRSPRWEDWEYEYLGEEKGKKRVNKLAWLGSGSSCKQSKDGGPLQDQAWYLYPRFMEPNVPVSPRPEDNETYRIRPFSS